MSIYSLAHLSSRCFNSFVATTPLDTGAKADRRRELGERIRWARPLIAADELRFRVRCAAGILDTLNTAAMQTELHHTNANELERLLIPVITGALSNPRAAEEHSPRPRSVAQPSSSARSDRR